MQFPVTIHVRASRRLRAALVFVHALALVGTMMALPPWASALPAVAAAVSLFAGWRSTTSICLVLARDGSVEWRFADDRNVPGEVLQDSTSFRWLTVLRIRLEGEGRRVRTVVLLADSLSAREMRYLQIWMRWVLVFRKAAAAG